MKKVYFLYLLSFGSFLASGAHAADPVFRDFGTQDWSGLYVGGSLGNTWSSVDFTHIETAGVGGAVTSSETFNTDPSSISGGVQAGLQKQFGSLLIGIEGAYIAQDADDSAGTVLNAFPRTRTSEIGDMWTLAGRVGYASGPWLGYAKAGYARAKVSFANFRNDTGALLAGSSKREGGLLLGAGVEYAITKELSFGADYTYINLDVGNQQQQLAGVAVAATNNNIDVDLHRLSIRLNYKFNVFGGN